jgi:hypothetical protein
MTNLITKAGLLIVIGLVALLPASANAQSAMRFHIPFQFLMGDKVLSAGDYHIRIDYVARSIELVSIEGAARAFLTGNTPYRTETAKETGTLRFYRYGKVHVLRNVWRSGAQLGYELPASKAEREMANREKASFREVASLGAQPK